MFDGENEAEFMTLFLKQKVCDGHRQKKSKFVCCERLVPSRVRRGRPEAKDQKLREG